MLHSYYHLQHLFHNNTLTREFWLQHHQHALQISLLILLARLFFIFLIFLCLKYFNSWDFKTKRKGNLNKKEDSDIHFFWSFSISTHSFWTCFKALNCCRAHVDGGKATFGGQHMHILWWIHALSHTFIKLLKLLYSLI